MNIVSYPQCEHCGACLRSQEVNTIFVIAKWQSRQEKFFPATSNKYAYSPANSPSHGRHNLSFCCHSHSIYHRRLDHYLIEVLVQDPSSVLRCWDEHGHQIDRFWPVEKAVR